MRYAVIENNTVVNVILAESNEAQNHSDWVLTETALIGDQYDSVNFNPVRELQISPLPPQTWVIADIRNNLSLAERVKWDNDKTETIKTAKIEFSNPRVLEDVEEILQMLVDADDISSSSMTAIIGVNIGVSRV